MRWSFCFVGILILCYGCGQRQLERPDVPIVWGMRMMEAADTTYFASNIAEMKSQDMQDLLVELALKADSNGLPIVAAKIPLHFMELLRQNTIRLHLAFTTTTAQDIFPNDSIPDREPWFGSLQSNIEAQLLELEGFPVQRVVIAGEWGPMASRLEDWTSMMKKLRAKFPAVPFSIGGRVIMLDSSGLGAISDEIAIDYPPIAGEELKAPCRLANQAISELAIELGKPVFIYRANVIGFGPTMQIKNRLRFWPETVRLSGICLNTLYPRIPPLDAKTYYGLADDREALDYVQRYRQGKAD